ncbi:MAG: anaerobic ribonucleoside-triphosphate reductase activating protein [Lachnospiraceae bacterium]|nr:anaerobic ribonucleoside-triphosphate reductase activating protein [Lachnospiraceae bacterium]
MNVAEIKYNDIANGLGVRTSLFVSGCTHCCKGCFNEIAWDFAYGEPFSDEIADRLIEATRPGYIRGLSLLGGEPMEPVNQEALLPFLQRFHAQLPDKDIWCYTGYTLETDLLAADGRARCASTDGMLALIDVLVDGEFVLEQKSLMLKFRGSANQRLIDLKATLAAGSVVDYQYQ